MVVPRMRARLPRARVDARAYQQAARLIVFIVLSALGAMAKLPGPLGAITLEAAPGYFAALAFSWGEGALVAGLGSLLSALLSGFPLGMLVHLYTAAQASLWATCLRLAYERGGPVLALLATIFLAGVVAAALSWPLGGAALVTSSLAPLILAAAVNVFLGTAFYVVLMRSKVVYVRKR